MSSSFLPLLVVDSTRRSSIFKKRANMKIGHLGGFSSAIEEKCEVKVSDFVKIVYSPPIPEARRGVRIVSVRGRLGVTFGPLRATGTFVAKAWVRLSMSTRRIEMRHLMQWWRRGRLSIVAGACAFILSIGTYGCDFESEAEMPPADEEVDPDEPTPDDRPPDGMPEESEPEEVPDGEVPDEEPEEEVPDGTPVDPSPMSATVFERAAFDPSGRYVLQLVEMAEGRCLAVADIDTGIVEHNGSLCGLRWIEVGPEGHAYVLSADGHLATVLDLASMSVVQTYVFENEFRVLDLSPDLQSLVASNRPVRAFDLTQYEWRVTDLALRFVGVVDLAADVAHEQPFPFAIRSIAFSPVDGAVLVGAGWWQANGLPETRVYWMNPVSGLVEDEVAFPNCAADLQVQPQGTLLLMSPNVCFLHSVTLAPPPVQEEPTEDWEEEWEEWEDEEDWDEWDSDPVSIVELETREYVGKLPGFGPLALSPDGTTAIGFSRQQALMKQWNMFQQQPHGLLLIRLTDLYWKFLEHGSAEPDFTFASSGELLIHDREAGDDRLLKMSLETESVEEFSGPPATLEESSFAPEGMVLYTVFDGDVQRVEVSAKAISTLATPTTVAQIFARPQGDLIIAAGAEPATLHLLDADGGTLIESIDL